MKRWTKKALDGYTQDCNNCGKTVGCWDVECCLHEFTQRLAAYENSGLTPEEVSALKAENERLKRKVAEELEDWVDD
jgi:hypothetical protein